MIKQMAGDMAGKIKSEDPEDVLENGSMEA